MGVCPSDREWNIYLKSTMIQQTHQKEQQPYEKHWRCHQTIKTHHWLGPAALRGGVGVGVKPWWCSPLWAGSRRFFASCWRRSWWALEPAPAAARPAACTRSARPACIPGTPPAPTAPPDTAAHRQLRLTLKTPINNLFFALLVRLF